MQERLAAGGALRREDHRREGVKEPSRETGYFSP
jgi:hypothetical protein